MTWKRFVMTCDGLKWVGGAVGIAVLAELVGGLFS